VAKDRVMDTIRKVALQHEHNTIVFTTHDIEVAVALADTIWIMGHEKDKVGATVVRAYNLADQGLAWFPEIERHPRFWPLVLEIKDLFQTL
jgi:ABC-type nitrate/sulfonate/bicarbonate transport system ATPase subunit